MTMWLPLCFGGLYLAQGAIIQNINDWSHEKKEFLDNKEKFYFETTSSMSQTKKLIDDFLTKNKLDDNVWVIFDVDLTLTKTMLQAGDKTYEVYKKHFTPFFESMGMDEEKKYDVWRWISYSLQTLIDPDTTKILNELREKNLKVFSLTACASKNKFIKTKALNRIGLDFKDAFDFSDLILDNLHLHMGQYPCFYNGFLFSNGEDHPNNKGMTLRAFIKKIKQTPSCIIVVDDKKKNLNYIYDSIADLNIKYFPILAEFKQKDDEVPNEVIKEYIEKILKEHDA